ncbi:glycosyl transferase [Burkholderia pseudomallei]|uniref:glycosyl transferase n=1 Tax=Burkholderia pseudomallei TaxID=28450 RepID=UPI00050EFE82|nr:glycosyl transferase [Burkholderia pseudomallei]KGX76620.1 glycosyl transferase 4 family protein [Burkholderia pseudomallei MSHR435]AJX23140.1 glycosyl transferase 4 family protein [Burkholderia pseudomallei MSHR491]KGC65939.1 glycosyl transferase 4 family protein [Burkholderia pseudomallei]KGS41485.1 glycosyl transferase 4 family protein [Burkholderia pseudomallei ABCPW 107]KGW23346.1 glycosyl transferase 4 family protein [Burkholderia pseudomallei MSHR733]
MFQLNLTILSAMAFASIAAIVTALILKWLLASGWAWRLATDVPNARSMHTRPTPRMGGWGIVPVGAVAIGIAAPHLWGIVAAMLFLAIVSHIDDRRGLPARVRFAAHLIASAAIAALYSGGLAWFWIPIVAVGLAWLINLYNFMDGADGLAGGMTVFGFGSYAFAALAGPHPSVGLGWACAAIAGAAAGFLLLNFHPAKLFLGDAGSISLGLLAGAFGYWGWRHAVWPLWFPLVVFAPFIADASVTLLRRLLRREKFWEAHREHYYQRMVRLGVGHARTALCWYAIMLVGAVVSLSVLACSTAVQWMTIAAWGSILFLLGVAIDVCWSRFQILTSK